ncbi:MAG: SDR family oxidoreductase [Actinomycetota bacterium]
MTIRFARVRTPGGLARRWQHGVMGESGVAVVTGANRGIGLEVTRQLAALGYVVYLGSRDRGRGQAAAVALGDVGDVRVLELDVADRASVERAADRLGRDHSSVDALVNNAAIHYDVSNRATAPDRRVVEEAMQTNVSGAWEMMLAFLPLLRSSDRARIVNVSSGAGALSDMGGGLPAYRLSKVALNALTRMWADELAVDGIKVNAVCPGWVATDMGGGGGRPVRDGAAGVVWAATLDGSGPSGGFFRDEQPIDW